MTTKKKKPKKIKKIMWALKHDSNTNKPWLDVRLGNTRKELLQPWLLNGEPHFFNGMKIIKVKVEEV